MRGPKPALQRRRIKSFPDCDHRPLRRELGPDGSQLIHEHDAEQDVEGRAHDYAEPERAVLPVVVEAVLRLPSTWLRQHVHVPNWLSRGGSAAVSHGLPPEA